MIDIPTPNKDRLRLWVKDLREGNHKQTGGVLGRVDDRDGSESFCCVGRLHEVAIADGVPIQRQLQEGAIGYGCSAHTAYITPEVADWLEIPDVVGSRTGAVRKYATMNDNCSTFPMIADAIEKDFDL